MSARKTFLLVRSGRHLRHRRALQPLSMDRWPRIGGRESIRWPPGITPASICAPERRHALRLLIRSRSGRSSRTASASSSSKASAAQAAGQNAARVPRQDPDRRRRRRGLCRGGNAAAAGISRQHRDAEATMPRRRWTGRTCQKTILPQRAEDWLPLRPDSFYGRSRDRAAAQHRRHLDGHHGTQCHYCLWGDHFLRPLLLATGAEPVRLPIRVPTSRISTCCATLADCRRS